MSLLVDQCAIDRESLSSLSNPLCSLKIGILSIKKCSTRINFATTCSVILIPSRREYFEAGIDLWYNRYDQARAQKEVAEEVRSVLHYHPTLKISQAISFLYQPHHMEEMCWSALNVNFNHMSLSDVKERLNILFIHSAEYSEHMECMYSTIKAELSIYNQWVVSASYVSSCEEAIRTLHTTNTAVSRFDIMIIHENVLLEAEEHRLMALLGTVHSLYGETGSVVVGCVSALTPSSTNSSSSDIRANIQEFITKEQELEKEQGGIVDYSKYSNEPIALPPPPTDEDHAEYTKTRRSRSNTVSVDEAPCTTKSRFSLADKIRQLNLHFLWKERDVVEVTHILPILLKQAQASLIIGSNSRKEEEGKYFKKTRSPPYATSPMSHQQARKKYESDSSNPSPEPIREAGRGREHFISL